MSDFKIQLEELIQEAAKKYDSRFIKDGNFVNSFHCSTSFKAGCEFLVPIIDVLLNIRNNYCDRLGYFDLDFKKKSDKDFIAFLKGTVAVKDESK